MTSQDILKALAQLNEATAELRHTIKDAHAARRDLNAAVKDQRDAISKAIEEETAKQVGVLSEEVREAMKVAVVETMNRFEADWRVKLGLT
jgi:septal ring factor EnvC (AmiA/AmiB activator)